MVNTGPKTPNYEDFVQSLLDRLPLEDVFERLDIVPIEAIMELHDTGFVDLSYYASDDNDSSQALDDYEDDADVY